MNRIGKFFDRVLSFLLPHKCLSCGEICEDVLCKSCSKKLADEYMRECKNCGRRLSLCGCIPESLESAGCSGFGCVFYYDKHSDDVSRRILLKLKTNDYSDSFELIASLMAAMLGDRSGWIVTNVPRRRSAVLEYGFDQAEYIAREVADKLGCEYRSLITNCGRSEQKMLNAKQRIEAAHSSYRIKNIDCRGQRILLIDDIITSGATTAECTKLLIGNGAAEVHVAAAARSVGVNVNTEE